MLNTTYFCLNFYFYNSALLSSFPRINYANGDTENLQIIKNTRGKSGVFYLLRNNINGKRYVGSSVNLSKRFF